MGSEVPIPPVEESPTLKNRPCPSKRNQMRLPKRIHKAAREKLKREHLNELFLELASALELSQQNSGKASILCEATRLLKDLLGQIQNLKKENASLLSESHYVTLEKNELKEENSALEVQIEKLHGELGEKLAQSKPDLNVPPPPEVHEPELAYKFPADSFRSPAIGPALQKGPTVLVVPLPPDLQAFPLPHHAAELASKPSSNLSKPHARYPTPADSWPSQLLGKQPAASREVQVQNSTSNTEPCLDNM